MENEQLITLTADIVSAHVANNKIDAGAIAGLVQGVYGALSSLGQEQAQAKPKVPVVSVRASIRPDHLVCMECGSKQKMLKRHLQTAHQMTPDQYRQDYGLPRDYPMSAPEYSDRRRELAKSIGLGRKKGEKVTPKGKGRGGKAKAPDEAEQQVPEA